MAVYLDNSATTKPCREAVEAVNYMMTENFGNPSSLHTPGIEAAKSLISAREAIARALGCEKDEIYFTSGATEANNLALFGAAAAKRRAGNRIVTTAIEHESVVAAADELEKQGFEVIRLMPDKHGNISAADFAEAINDKTILVSAMYINNEIGSIMPIDKIKKIIEMKKAPALFHTDCVQAFGKVKISPRKLGADMISVTAHKIHGPKGTGALYIKKGTRILPRVFGGEQEKRMRPGTEASPLIAGFGAEARAKAVSSVEQLFAAALPDTEMQSQAVSGLNSYLRELLSKIDGIQFNSDENASPYILNVYVPTFMRSQTIVQELSSKYEVYVSNGSACAKGKKSHVLAAMHLSDEIADKSIRISFSRFNTKQDCEICAAAIKDLTEKHPR